MGTNKLLRILLVLSFTVSLAVPSQAQVPSEPEEGSAKVSATVDEAMNTALAGAESEAPTMSAIESEEDSGNVTLDFKDADIINVLRILSIKSGVNIVTGPEVAGTVTVRLQDVPWEKALTIVLRTYGYVFEREGNVIRVTTKENIQTEELITEAFVLNLSAICKVCGYIFLSTTYVVKQKENWNRNQAP